MKEIQWQAAEKFDARKGKEDKSVAVFVWQ